MALRDDLLPLIDTVRSIPGVLGLHRFQVWVRKTVYAGSRIGEGAFSITETRLLVGGQDPHVKELKSQDIAAGADDLQGVEYEIGPFTPNYPALSVLDPAQDGQPTVVTYLLKGPGLPTSGLLCTKVSDDVSRPLRNVLRVRSTGRSGA